MEDNSPAASSSQKGRVERFRSDVSQGELSIAQLLESEDRLQKSVEPEVQELPEEEVRVDLEDPAALATFLVTANIKLIRAEYLVHLVTEGRRLPRRQEAEGENFVDRAGKTRSALVDHEEVQAWASGSKKAIIASVSHAWEAREHPDPCGHQLEQVAQHAAWFVAAFAADIWLFFDYVSLFQFKREKETEEQSFRRSMENMHAMYAHESTMTFRLESLTPEHRWQKAIQDGSQVTIFHFLDTNGRVEPVPLHALTRNTNPYLERGWCRAEVNWSSVRGHTAQHQRIDVEVTETKEEGMDARLTALTPVAPEAFAAEMHSAAFTHRSDADAVVQLQKKVFLEKVTKRRKLKLEGVSLDQMQALTESLPYFKELKSISLNDFRCGANEAEAFVEALATTPIKKVRCKTGDKDSSICFVKAIAEFLKFNMTLVDLDLSWNDIDDKEAQVLAEALKENRTLQHLKLANTRIGVQGVQALQQALKTNKTLKRLELESFSWYPEAVKAIEAACRANPRICQPSEEGEANDGSEEESLKNPLEAAVRIEDLADQLRFNRTVMEVDLSNSNICDEQGKALASALHVNKTVTKVDLEKNKIGDEGLKALADAFRVNKTITKVNLCHNKIGDEGLKALANALRVNQTIKSVSLDWNKIGDEGLKALADAFRANKTVTEVQLGYNGNNFGDEGLKALASAMEVNENISEVQLNMTYRQIERLSKEGRQAVRDIKRFCKRNQGPKLEAAWRNRKCLAGHDLLFEKMRVDGWWCSRCDGVFAFGECAQRCAKCNFGFCLNCFQMQEVQEVCRSQSITEVDLSDRKLGDEHVKALANALRVNQTIKSVNLQSNKIGDEGLKALADALRVNKTITKVNLCHNKIGDEGLKALASAMEVNKNIKEVQLDMVPDLLARVEGHKAAEDIQRFCTRNKAIQESFNFQAQLAADLPQAGKAEP